MSSRLLTIARHPRRLFSPLTCELLEDRFNPTPVLTGFYNLPDLVEDQPADNIPVPGTEDNYLVNSIIEAGGYTQGPGPGRGIAVTQVENKLGQWQYDLGSGNWLDMPEIATADQKALLLAADINTRVRFVPNPDVNSFNNNIFVSIRGWNQADGTPEGKVVGIGTVNASLSAETKQLTVFVQSVADELAINPAAAFPGLQEDDKSPRVTFLNRAAVDDIDVNVVRISLPPDPNTLDDAPLPALPYGTLWAYTGPGKFDFFQVSDGTILDLNKAVNFGFSFQGRPDYWGPVEFLVQAGIQDPVTKQIEFGVGPTPVTFFIEPVADTPTVTNARTRENVPTTEGLTIERYQNATDPRRFDGPEVTHVRITDITNGTLFFPDNARQILNNSFVPFDEAEQGLIFRPALNFFGTATFKVQAATSPTLAGLGGGFATAQIIVDPVANSPTVTNAITNQNEQTTTGLVIIPAPSDKTSITFYQISNITNGTLFFPNGTTPISNGEFIPAAEGRQGLKFTPAPNFVGIASFGVQAAVGNTPADLGGEVVTATITVLEQLGLPQVTPTSTVTPEDTQTAATFVIRPNPADGGQATHFRIFNVLRGSVFMADGVTPLPADGFVTVAEGAAGLKFTPDPDFFGEAGFFVRSAKDRLVSQLSGPTQQVSITVTPVPDVPTVSNSSTLPNTQTTTGLTIVRNRRDGNEVTHYQITGINNGRLFQSDGVTPVLEGQFITVATGNAGLRFTPNAGFVGVGSFRVQASLSDAPAGLGGESALAQIAVGPDLNPPSVTPARTRGDTLTTGGLVVSLDPADVGIATHLRISNIGNGQVFLADGVTRVPEGGFITVSQGVAGLRFRATTGFSGEASFLVETSLGAFPEGISAPGTLAEIVVEPGPSTPSVNDASTTEDVPTGPVIVISPDPDDEVVTHYRIGGFVGGTVSLADGTPVPPGGFITVAQGSAGLIFVPAPDFFGQASFTVQASVGDALDGLGGDVVTATIGVAPVADTPSVNAVSTGPNQNTGPVIFLRPNPVDGDSVTHFRITNVLGGTLFLSNGTPVFPGQFITVAQAVGMSFQPAPGFEGVASFQAQASLNDTATGLGGGIVTGTITVGTPAPPVPPGPPPLPPGPFPRPPFSPFYVVGADVGGGPQVNVYDSATDRLIFSFMAYDINFTGGVRVAVGDINGDGIPDIVTVPGVGGGSQVNVYDGRTFELINVFFAYEPEFLGGAYVAIADLNGDGRGEIITGTGVGGGPRITVWDGMNAVNIGSFFAYEDSFRGGVLVSAGDLDGDGRAEIIAGSGVGGGPRVQVFDGVTFAELASFFAYDSEFRGGVFVGVGDLTGDGPAEIVTGPGVGGPNNVLVFQPDGTLLRNIPVPTASGTNPGLRVAVKERSPGQPEILVSAGQGEGSVVRVISGSEFRLLDEFAAFPGFDGGVFVG